MRGLRGLDKSSNDPILAAVRHEAFQYENRQMTFVDLPTTGVLCAGVRVGCVATPNPSNHMLLANGTRGSCVKTQSHATHCRPTTPPAPACALRCALCPRRALPLSAGQHWQRREHGTGGRREQVPASVRYDRLTARQAGGRAGRQAGRQAAAMNILEQFLDLCLAPGRLAGAAYCPTPPHLVCVPGRH